MAQINLLDTEQTHGFRRNGYSWLSKGMLALLLLTALFYGYMYIRQGSLQKQINEAREKTAEAQSQATNNTDRDELITRQGQVAALNPLIDDHVYWSGLLPELARISLRQSNYVTISAAANGNLVMSVEMPTYADLDKFLQVFDLPEYNKQFKDVRVLSISKGAEEGAVSYIMRVQLAFNKDFIKHAN